VWAGSRLIVRGEGPAGKAVSRGAGLGRVWSAREDVKMGMENGRGARAVGGWVRAGRIWTAAERHRPRSSQRAGRFLVTES